MDPIVIAGAGPGGLVAALCLQKRGIPVQLLERSPELRVAGAGIVMAVNAMRIMATLGLDKTLIEAGAVLDDGWVESIDLGKLQDFSLHTYLQRFGQPNVAIARGRLSTLLADALEGGILRFDAHVIDFEGVDGGVDVILASGERIRASGLVGADGIHSDVRQALWGDIPLRYSGYTCWRGLADIPCPLGNGIFTERWHRGLRFGIVPISESQTYWFATANTPEGGQDGADAKAEVRARFKDLGDGVDEILLATPQILRNDIVDFKPIDKWQRGRVTLMGDAAHAMTPNLGQGACQAIEDAMWLALALEKHPVEEAFALYERERMARAKSFVDRSFMMGRVATLENGLLTWLRDHLMRLTPQSLMEKNLDAVYGALPQLPAPRA